MHLKVATQLDIAPTIAKIYNLSFACEGRVLEDIVKKYKGSNIVLAIIDSLGFKEYKMLIGELIRSAAVLRRSIIYKCRVFSKRTTPSIATILCGLKPDTHKICTTGDVFNSSVQCLPEYLSENGIRSAVVMEETGALSFLNKVDAIVPIQNRDNILEFDDESLEAVLRLLKEGTIDFIVSHFRALDKYGYSDQIVVHLDNIIYQILSNMSQKWVLALCGDHPPHMSKQKYVPLLFSSAAICCR